MNRYWQFLRENGFYLFCANILAHIATAIRSKPIARKLGVKRFRIGARPYLRGLSYMRIGEDLSAESDLWIEAVTQHHGQGFTPTIVIGERARISRFVHIAATNLVEIGDDVLIGSKVMITDHNHGNYSSQPSSAEIPPSLRPLDGNRSVSIGSNVWLGDGVVVTPGSIIGRGSVIGANSVVNGAIPAYSLAAGAPARVIKTFDSKSQQWVNAE